eukprot:g2827.t1
MSSNKFTFEKHKKITPLNELSLDSKKSKGQFSVRNQGCTPAKEFFDLVPELTQEFKRLFPTDVEKRIFVRTTWFMEKALTQFANKKSKSATLEKLQFTHEFLLAFREMMDSPPKLQLKEKKKDEDEDIAVKAMTSNIRKKYSLIEMMAKREIRDIKFTSKRLITSNHEPYEVITKNTVGKFIFGERISSSLLTVNQTSFKFGLSSFSLTGIGVTALMNYAFIMTKNFVHVLWSTKDFTTLSCTLHSTKMGENRADMILGTAAKDRLYKKIGISGQKLVAAIVGSNSETVAWELTEESPEKGWSLFNRFRMDENNGRTGDLEFKVAMFSNESLEVLFKGVSVIKPEAGWYMIHEDVVRKTSFVGKKPSTLEIRVMCRRLGGATVVGIQDRYLCVLVEYHSFPEHGFAFSVSRDVTEKKYLDQIPDRITNGAIRVKMRLAGYTFEEVPTAKPMTKITYFCSIGTGGWIPSYIANRLTGREVRRVVNEYKNSLYSFYEIDELLQAHRSTGSMARNFQSFAQSFHTRTSRDSIHSPERATTSGAVGGLIT